MEVLVVGSKCCGSSDENIGDEMEVSTLNNQQGCEVTECRRGGGGGVFFTSYVYSSFESYSWLLPTTMDSVLATIVAGG